jgi:hypothetical protein
MRCIRTLGCIYSSHLSVSSLRPRGGTLSSSSCTARPPQSQPPMMPTDGPPQPIHIAKDAIDSLAAIVGGAIPSSVASSGRAAPRRRRRARRHGPHPRARIGRRDRLRLPVALRGVPVRRAQLQLAVLRFAPALCRAVSRKQPLACFEAVLLALHAHALGPGRPRPSRSRSWPTRACTTTRSSRRRSSRAALCAPRAAPASSSRSSSSTSPSSRACRSRRRWASASSASPGLERTARWTPTTSMASPPRPPLTQPVVRRNGGGYRCLGSCSRRRCGSWDTARWGRHAPRS